LENKTYLNLYSHRMTDILLIILFIVILDVKQNTIITNLFISYFSH